MSGHTPTPWGMSAQVVEPRLLKRGYGILSKFGNFWTDEQFETPEDATKHLRKFWGEAADISEFSIVHTYTQIVFDREMIK